VDSVGVLCQVVIVGCFGIIDDKNVIYISGVKQYDFGVYVGFDVDIYIYIYIYIYS